MIRSADDSSLTLLTDFCSRSINPFGCKIESLADAYGANTRFAGFWLQYGKTQENPTAAISRLDDAAVLNATDGADLNELAEFLSAMGISVLLCEKKIGSKIGGCAQSGSIMLWKKPGQPFVNNNSYMFLKSAEIERNPSLREVYTVLLSCRQRGFAVPAFEPFYVDMSHRIRHGAARCAGIRLNGNLVSCAMATAQTAQAAVLGAVATRPEYRRQGLGGAAVQALVSDLGSENRSVYLLRKMNESQRFYRELGFTDCGEWSEIGEITPLI